MVVKGKTITTFLLKGKRKPIDKNNLQCQFYLKILLAKGKVYETNKALLLKAKQIFEDHFAAQTADISSEPIG
jgi:hypothetical protein